ncbi:hypothetical protein EYF80_041214 [Liparis tanakae]|uniref:Uncharacterized protein n=1 Tax=Liparis tanakae TaxID=230148 RepID=A0A4Z2G693_9TELE|nr:hypothetical protein EYF80_041214 [Liparis tanakae]
MQHTEPRVETPPLLLGGHVPSAESGPMPAFNKFTWSAMPKPLRYKAPPHTPLPTPPPTSPCSLLQVACSSSSPQSSVWANSSSHETHVRLSVETLDLCINMILCHQVRVTVQLWLC